MNFSPCVKSVASPNGFKMSTNSFNRFHFHAVNDNYLCLAISRTAQRFAWLQWRTAFTCLSVEFHLVLTAAGMPFCSPTVLVCSSELSFDNFERKGDTTFVSFKPSPTTSLRVCAKHCKRCLFAIATSTVAGLPGSHQGSGSSRWSLSSSSSCSLGKHPVNAFHMLAELSLIM